MPTTGTPDSPTDISCQLLVIGASARHCAHSSFRMGAECVAFDFFSDWDLGNFARTVNILNLSQAQVCELLSGWDSLPSHFVICGGMEKRVELLNAMSRFCELVGTQPNDIARTNCPFEIERICKSESVAFPAIARNHPGSKSDLSWLVKPYLSAGGSLVANWRNEEPHIFLTECNSEDYFWQERIDGKSYSSVFCCDGSDTALIGSTEQLVGLTEFGLASGSFAYCGSLGPVHLDAQVMQEIKRIGTVVADRFKLSGVFGVDWVMDHYQQVSLIEINPRITSSCEVFELAGVCPNIVETHLRTALELEPPLLRESNGIVGKAVVFNRSSAVKIDESLFEFLSRNSLHDTGSSLGFKTNAWRLPQNSFADIPNVGSVIGAGGPIVSVFSSGSNRRDVFGQLVVVANEIHSRIKKLEAL